MELRQSSTILRRTGRCYTREDVAAAKAACDYALHVIVTDPAEPHASADPRPRPVVQRLVELCGLEGAVRGSPGPPSKKEQKA